MSEKTYFFLCPTRVLEKCGIVNILFSVQRWRTNISGSVFLVLTVLRLPLRIIFLLFLPVLFMETYMLIIMRKEQT